MAGKTWNDSPPSNYVSLLQLKEIWMKKQEEKKLREKEEEERRKQEEEEKKKQEEELRKQEEERRKQEAERRNGGRGRIGRGHVRIVVDEKGNGMEITLEGNGDRWSDRNFRRGESVGYGRNRNEIEKEKFVRGEIPEGKRMGFGGGFRKNGRSRLDQLKKNEGESDFGRGMLGDREYNEERGERGRNNGGLKESRDVVLKGKEVEPETVKKGEDENGGPYGRNRLNQLKQNEGGSDFGGGVLGDKGYNEERGERGRNNGGFLNRYSRLKESGDVVLKGKEVEPETLKKGEDGNGGPYGRSRNLHGDRDNQLKQNEGGSDFGGGMLGDRGYNEERGERGRNNGGFQIRYNGLKESGDVVSKGEEVEPQMVKEGEVLGERRGLRGRGSNRFKRRNKRIEEENLREGDRNSDEKRKETNEVMVEGEGFGDDKVGDGGLTMERMKNDKKEGVGEGYRRDRNWRKSKRRFNRFKESRDDVIGNKLEIETEKKAEGEILEAFNEKCGLSEGDRNDDEKRTGTNEVKAEREGFTDDRMALDSVKNGKKEGVGKGYRRFGDWKGKAKDEVFNEKRCLSEGDGNDDGKRNDARAEGEGLSDEVLTVESVKNEEKEGVGKGYGRHGNGHNRFGNEKGNFAERFGNRRGKCGRQRMNQGGSGMMWVKKEEKSGAAAAAGSSGVQNIKSNRIPTNRAFWNDRVY